MFLQIFSLIFLAFRIILFSLYYNQPSGQSIRYTYIPPILLQNVEPLNRLIQFNCQVAQLIHSVPTFLEVLSVRYDKWIKKRYSHWSLEFLFLRIPLLVGWSIVEIQVLQRDEVLVALTVLRIVFIALGLFRFQLLALGDPCAHVLVLLRIIANLHFN